MQFGWKRMGREGGWGDYELEEILLTGRGGAGEERLWAIAQAGVRPIQVLSPHSNIAAAHFQKLSAPFSLKIQFMHWLRS